MRFATEESELSNGGVYSVSCGAGRHPGQDHKHVRDTTASSRQRAPGQRSGTTPRLRPAGGGFQGFVSQDGTRTRWSRSAGRCSDIPGKRT